MNEGAGDEYMQAMALDEPVTGLVLGEVVESRHSDYAKGDVIMGRTRWESYSVADGTDYMTKMEAVDPDVPLSCYLGVLGPTGLTAYFGMRDVGQPREGETVVISTAAGAVGSVAAQLAKIHGCRTIGLTSTDDKCRWLVDELGLDAAINYRAPGGLEAGLARHCPDGVDVYFDNVGGETLDTVLRSINLGARILICGAISQYNATEPVPGPSNYLSLLVHRARMEGFLVTDYESRYLEAWNALGGWISEGRIKSREDVVDGLENAPRALLRLFDGSNTGKLLVRISGG
jgi:NADPH-dependent curcumin reductase CurA